MKVIVPEILKKYTYSSELNGRGNTIQEIFDNLIEEHPYLQPRLRRPNGDFNTFVNIYVNDEDIRFLNNKLTVVKESDVITIIPSIAGG